MILDGSLLCLDDPEFGANRDVAGKIVIISPGWLLKAFEGGCGVAESLGSLYPRFEARGAAALVYMDPWAIFPPGSMVYHYEKWDKTRHQDGEMMLLQCSDDILEVIRDWARELRHGTSIQVHVTPARNVYRELFDGWLWLIAMRLVCPLLSFWTSLEAFSEIFRLRRVLSRLVLDALRSTVEAVSSKSRCASLFPPPRAPTEREPEPRIIALTVCVIEAPCMFLVGASLAAGSVDRISEIQREVSSCPVLFAHDGDEFRFVSDVLGVGGVGYLLEPGVYSEPRPFERFPMPAGSLAPDQNGRLRLVLCEPMEEVCYLDAVKLVGWSLPEDWSLAVDERLAIEGPPATGEPIFFRTTLDPVTAINDRGDSILPTVTNADRTAAPLPRLDHRFIGRLDHEHVVTIEFDRPIPTADGPRTPWLLMDGWVEYPYAQTMFAAWQAKASYDAPTLEARGADGAWFVVQRTFGYPAGMPRTSAFPLSELPEGCDALRLRTNQEVYWDRLRVVIGESAPPDARRVTLPPSGAEFSAIGFPKRIDGPQRCPDYDWSTRSPLWDVRHQRGRYTGFGDVLDLVSAADGAVVTIGPGEGVEITFEAPPGADSMHWILDNHGWCKDRDRFTRDGETIDPIPGEDVRDDEARILLQSTRSRIEAGR